MLDFSMYNCNFPCVLTLQVTGNTGTNGWRNTSTPRITTPTSCPFWSQTWIMCGQTTSFMLFPNRERFGTILLFWLAALICFPPFFLRQGVQIVLITVACLTSVLIRAKSLSSARRLIAEDYVAEVLLQLSLQLSLQSNIFCSEMHLDKLKKRKLPCAKQEFFSTREIFSHLVITLMPIIPQT